jgi:hypothetical protein
MAKKKSNPFRKVLDELFGQVWTWLLGIGAATWVAIKSHLDGVSLGAVVPLALVALIAVLVLGFVGMRIWAAIYDWRKPRLVVKPGEVHIGVHGEYLFRVRVSASNRSEIDDVECCIYDVCTCDEFGSALSNQLNAMQRRPLERMHFFGQFALRHRLAEGDHLDYDLIFETPSREWRMRFAMKHSPEEVIPKGNYCVSVIASAPGAKSAIQCFDVWKDEDGRLALSLPGKGTSVAKSVWRL